MTKYEETNLWIFDEANSSAGSKFYRKPVDKSVIEALPKYQSTFKKRETIVEKLARFLLRIAD